MPQKTAPKWLVKKVYKINLRLLNEGVVDMDGIIPFWEALIAETKLEKLETKNNDTTR